MNLFDRLQDEMKASLKSGDSGKLSVIRMLVAEIKTYCIDKNVKAAEEPEIIKIIQRHIKQHKDSIAQFEKGGRGDLVSKEAAELTILKGYMPKELTEEELSSLVREVIKETGAATRADMGKVMKLVMERALGRADGKAVNQLIAGLLTK